MQECPNSKTAYMYPNDYSCAYILGTKKKKKELLEKIVIFHKMEESTDVGCWEHVITF